MRDKVQRSSNIAEKFIVTIGFCITTVLTIITAFIYPEYTSHIALFGLLSLCTFYVSHNIIEICIHLFKLDYCPMPAIILFCLYLRITVRWKLLFFMRINLFSSDIVLSSALVNAKCLLCLTKNNHASSGLKKKKIR